MAKQRHPSPPICELRSELQSRESSAWRVIRLSSGVLLPRLHRVLLAAMGWFSAEDWWFVAAGTHYSAPNGQEERQAASTVRLRHILPDTGYQATYVIVVDRTTWTHQLTLVRLLTPNPDMRAPVCIAGAETVPTGNARASGFDVRVTNAELKRIGDRRIGG